MDEKRHFSRLAVRDRLDERLRGAVDDSTARQVKREAGLPSSLIAQLSAVC
jgi:hypothetical protein